MPIIPISGSAVARGAIIPLGTFIADGTTVSPNFINIPQGYQDLMLISSVRSSSTGGSPQSVYILPNADSSNNKSVTTLQGNGASVASARYSGGAFMYSASITTAQSQPDLYSTQITHILNYAKTNIFKTLLTTWACDLDGRGVTGVNAVLYPFTTAVTSITSVVDGVVNLTAGTTYTLYGVRSVNQ